MQNVLKPILSKAGYNFDIEILKEGFYPKGGAVVNFKSKKCKLGKINLTEKSKSASIRGISVASNDLKERKVADLKGKLKMSFVTTRLAEVQFNIVS